MKCACVPYCAPARNAGLCCVHGVDDVGFIDAALSAVWSTLNLRTDSVHVTGFSNGVR